MKRGINVYNEIKSLKKVILYRPGNELLNVLPSNLDDYNFKDIPDLEKIQKEHDSFANLLRQEGVDVVYLIDLIVDCLSINTNIKEKFIKQFIKETGIKIDFISKEVYKFLIKIEDTRKLVIKCIEGIRYSELNTSVNGFFRQNNIDDLVIKPLANMFNLHNQITFIGDKVVFTSNKESKIHRETIFLEYIFKYHPKYKDYKLYNERYNNNFISTSDLLVVNNEVVLIGLSTKTEPMSVTNLANKILNEKKFKYIIVIDIASKNLSLDSMISMIDYDKFVINTDLVDISNIYELALHNDSLVISSLHMSLENVLEKYLHLNKINLIKCGNGDYYDSKREQHHKAANILCIKPNVVLVYGINKITNEQLKLNGIKVIELNTSEFLKGTGGLHNMTVPLVREN